MKTIEFILRTCTGFDQNFSIEIMILFYVIDLMQTVAFNSIQSSQMSRLIKKFQIPKLIINL